MVGLNQQQSAVISHNGLSANLSTVLLSSIYKTLLTLPSKILIFADNFCVISWKNYL